MYYTRCSVRNLGWNFTTLHKDLHNFFMSACYDAK
jgi:hypothetical protein